MEIIRKIKLGEKLPSWFEDRRWKNAHTKKYLDKLEDYLVVKIDDKIVASAQITFSKYTNCYHLASLWVNEPHRGKKLGQKLIKELLSRTKADKVYMDTSKKELIPYYAKCGFELVKNNLEKFKKELLLRSPNKDLSKQSFLVCDFSKKK